MKHSLHLCPGDLLVLKWIDLDTMPQSSYLVIAIDNDHRVMPGHAPEPAFWYYNVLSERLSVCPFRTVENASRDGHVVIVGTFRRGESVG